MNISIREAFLGTQQQKNWAKPVSGWVWITKLGEDNWTSEAMEKFPEILGSKMNSDLTKLTSQGNFSYLKSNILRFMWGHNGISVDWFIPNSPWAVAFNENTKRMLVIEREKAEPYIQMALDYIDSDPSSDPKEITL